MQQGVLGHCQVTMHRTLLSLVASIAAAAYIRLAAANEYLIVGMLYRFTDDRAQGAYLRELNPKVLCALIIIHYKPDTLLATAQTWLTVAMSGLIGMDMFNNRDSTFIEEYRGLDCPVYFNYTMYDDRSTPVGAMIAYRSREHDILVGPARSVASVPTAIVGGIDHIPQMSYWATSPALDDKDYYTYYMRTIPADSALAQALMDYLVACKFLAVQVKLKT